MPERGLYFVGTLMRSSAPSETRMPSLVARASPVYTPSSAMVYIEHDDDVPEPDLPELDFTPVPKRTVAPRDDDGFEEAD